jgi:hypothetical protein
MQLLSEIIVNGASHSAIQLLQGDITAIPEEYRVDILVVSAFPNDYTPLPGSIMYALHEKGIDVGELAKDKAVDLVEQLGCWLSNPLGSEQQAAFNIKQILCFEPSRQAGEPETVVGNIFRCINNFAFEDHINTIAMAVLASGKQRVPIERMLPAMLDACIFWLESGIPLYSIKLIVHTDAQAQAALPLFDLARQQHASNPAQSLKSPVQPSQAAGSLHGFAAPPPPPPVAAPGQALSPIPPAPLAPPALPVPPTVTGGDYDFFISYSHVQTPEVAELVKALKEKDSKLNIFYDRSSIPPGALWIKLISDAIQHSKYVVCILSPQYRNSDACWDEFQCAKAKEYRTKKPVIKTINLLTDTDMPLIMAVYSYIDCTEGDLGKLK